MLTLLSKRINYRNGVEDYIGRCKKYFSNSFQFQLSQVDKIKVPLDKILNALPKETNKEKVSEIYNSQGLKNTQLAMVEFFVKVINEERDKIRRRILILETIKNQPNGLLKYLLELSVALDSDNQAWSKKIAKKVVLMGPQEILFPRAIESSEHHDKLVSTTKAFLTKFKLVFKDKILKKMFINQLVNLMPTENLKEELPFWLADWTLTDLRGFLDSATYGKPFVGFWYLELISATYEAEVLRFLRDVTDEKSVKKYGQSYPWLLALYPIKGLENQIVPIFKDLWESDTSYNRYIVLELLENSYFKLRMAKEIPELGKPLFQLKRTLFFNMLRRGENLNFSIYQLLKLGDRSEELLWWITFFEK